jgi:hypothetical protein
MRRIAFALGALVLCGCGHTEVHQVLLRVPTGKVSYDAELYLGDQNPRRPYYEMALIQAIGYGADANLEDVTDALRERGRYFGCDGLIRVRVDQGYSMAHGFGVCVKWAQVVATPVPVPVPAPAPPASMPDAGSDSGEIGF